jgi:hypothetical protein
MASGVFSGSQGAYAAKNGQKREAQEEDLKSHGNRTIAAIDEADAEYVPLYSDTTTHQVALSLGNAF